MAGIVTQVGLRKFREHVVIEAVERLRDLPTSFEVENAGQFTDNPNGSPEKPSLVRLMPSHNPVAREFDSLNGRVVQQNNKLNAGCGQNLRLPIVRGGGRG